MRKIEATIRINAKGYPVIARPKAAGASFEPGDNPGVEERDGYILLPLKKATSRNKGNSFERKVADVFSMWLYGKPKVMRRTPLSGGWGAHKQGDICLDVSQPFSAPFIYVECRNVAGALLSFLNWVKNPKSTILQKWIAEVSKKARDGKWTWFLVMHDPSLGDWVLCEEPKEPFKHALVATLSIGDAMRERLILFPLENIGREFINGYEKTLTDRVLNGSNA